MLMKKHRDKKLNRYIIIYLLMAFIFGTIITRLYKIQVVNGEYYGKLVDKNSYKEVALSAPRGTIYDSTGTELATSKLSYQVTFMETEDSDKDFFTTMSQVFKILDENGENQVDDFAIKANPYKFQFSSDNASEQKNLLLRFLKDRGFQDKIIKKLYPGEKEAELTDAQVKKVNAALLKITAEQAYNQLLKDYKIADGLKKAGIKYTAADMRRYLIVKDSLKMQSFSNYKPIVIANNIKTDTSYIFWQKLNDLPGIDVTTQPIRYYPYGSLASAVLGYLGKINPEKQDIYEEKGYDVNTDYIGKAGIEAAFEDILKGEKGSEIVKVNTQGRAISQLASKDAYPGESIHLTINKDVQYAADTALDKWMQWLQQKGHVSDANTKNATRGAAIAINVKTGGILALSSRPGYDPNIFTDLTGSSQSTINAYFNPDYEALAKEKGMSQSQIDFMFPVDKSIAGNTTIREDKYDYFPKVLYNYATMPLIPPGSTFKPITAVAGLETGIIDRYTTIDDPGRFDDDVNNFHDVFTADGSHGPVNLIQAIGVSSNPYFMTVGKWLRSAFGDDIIAKYAWQFGLGAKPGSKNLSTGIEIPENFGQVYNKESQANRSAVECLIELEQYFKAGYDDNLKKSFQPIDLYANDNDNKTVTDAKKQIKDVIKSAVKTGKLSNNYKQLLKNLVAADPEYKGKKFTDTDYENIINATYYDAVSKNYWQLQSPYNVYIASIGQGMDAFTPLQLVDYVATLVNGGTRYKLHLVDNITDANGNVIEQVKPQVLNKVDIKQSTIDAIKEGMKAATSSGDGGTAAAAFEGFPLDTGGKTGSATFNEKLQDQIGRSSYGFYVGFAPYDDPQIAVVAVIFDGGYGSNVANVARAMYEAYFQKELKSLNYSFQYDVTAKSEK